MSPVSSTTEEAYFQMGIEQKVSGSYAFASHAYKEQGKEKTNRRWLSSSPTGQLLGDKSLGQSTRESHTNNGELEFREDGLERDLTLGE